LNKTFGLTLPMLVLEGLTLLQRQCVLEGGICGTNFSLGYLLDKQLSRNFAAPPSQDVILYPHAILSDPGLAMGQKNKESQRWICKTHCPSLALKHANSSADTLKGV
jgi:hypothetical protein